MLSRIDDTEIALEIKLPVSTFIINSDFISLMLSFLKIRLTSRFSLRRNN